MNKIKNEINFINIKILKYYYSKYNRINFYKNMNKEIQEEKNIENILKEFNKYLKEFCIKNSGLNDENTMKITSSFHCKEEPKVSIYLYINNIVKLLEFKSHNLYILIIHCIVYLNRLLSKGYRFNNYNIHRTILILLLISHKIYEDIPYNNISWSKKGGVKDINLMEIEMLKYLDYNLFVSEENVEETFEKITQLYKKRKSI
jgi:hypothetical protein